VLKTTNFGATWVHTTNEPVGISTEAGWNNSLAMTDADHIWFGTNNNKVWRTADGGATWASSASGSTNSYAISFKDNTSGIVGHSGGTMRVTSDGGATFAATASPTTSDISGLAYLGGTAFVWAVAGGSPYRSLNGAGSWTAQTVFPISGTLTHVSFVDTTAGWVVTSNGEILHYPTTLTSIEGQPDNSPLELALQQNYPNPFNPTTAIGFSLPTAGYVSLNVYDVLGREVATMVNEELSSGNYQRTFSANGLASGVYIYRLRSGSLVQEKRMLLIR
jgi:hypothetical protein